MNNQELIEQTYLEAAKEIKEDWFFSDMPYWYSYVINLPKHLQITYLTVVMENQVLNGGFHQYFANSYGQFSKETIDALIEIGAFKKSNLLDKALKIVQDKNMTDQEFRKMLMNKTLKKLFIEDDLFEPLEELDDMYYDIDDEDITDLLGKFLNK
ncbi:DMP19 family protein [Chryseobacterium sp. 2R14A]|uniref:DMP19 family protein n=1 Tax=Chryseobacterium sp. 2R14A TaxID=3380353 RepID=UPI003CF85E01